MATLQDHEEARPSRTAFGLWLLRPGFGFSKRQGQRLLAHGALSLVLLWGLAGCNTPVIEEKVTCRSPGGKTIAKIEAWKFDRVRKAILEALPADGSPRDFSAIARDAAARIPAGEAEHIGKIPWFIETVSLEMEVRGELERVKEAGKKKRLRRVP